MKLIIVLLSVAARSIAELSEDSLLNILDGKAVDLGALNGAANIGSLPPLTEQNSDDLVASENAIKLAEIVRRVFPTGFNTMPPLDPYTKEYLGPINLDFFKPLVTGQAEVFDIVATGAQSFKLWDVELRVFGREVTRVDWNVTLPILNIQASFKVKLLLKGLIPFNFDGNIKIQLTNLNVAGASGGSVDVSSGAQKYKIDSVKAYGVAENVKVKVTLNSMILKVLQNNRNLIMAIYALLKDDLGNIIGQLGIQESNAILSGFTVQQIQTSLLGHI